MVYNFRMAQITKQHIFENPQRHSTVIALPFEQFRKKYDGTHQNFGGMLGSYLYNFNPYYFRADAAFSQIHESRHHETTFSGTEMDDILFSFGRTFQLHERAPMTLTGLLGFPTHQIYRLRHVDFGYSQIGTGIQCDGLYAFDDDRALLYGARYLHFVPRTARDDAGNAYDFTIGNIGDLFMGYKQYWGKHGLEVGYTNRTRFGAKVCPNFDDIVQKTNYVRNNFYIVYKYKFNIGDLPNRLLLYISYGFDQKPKVFGNQSIITLWGSWNISF